MRKIILFLLMLCINKVFAQAPTNGLVAYWPLDGNFNDASGNAINGTNLSATSTTNKNGLANKAMNFANPTTPATAQYGSHPITSSLNFTVSQDFTFSFWVYVNSPYNHTCGIYDNNLNQAGYGAWFWNTNGFPQINFNWRNSYIGTTNGAVPLATWKHISCVKLNTTLYIYVNGVLNVTGNGGATSPSYPLTGKFGVMSFNGSPALYNGMEGKIDEVRIYNRALTAAELTAVALPIRLTSFSGSLSNNKTTLNWQTEYEQNTKDFIVQRSIDNSTFESVGKVLAVGNSNAISKYNFVDNISNINANKIYYRLQSNDVDGKQTYSDIISFKKASIKGEITISPNPAKDKILIQAYFAKAVNASVKVIHTNGKIVLQQTLNMQSGNNSFPLNIASLPKGNYFLKIETLDENYVKEILKF
jgi:Concanavalin A-like lectin/glucanases superfamily/Secretion system C-terminal sorting domain